MPGVVLLPILFRIFSNAAAAAAAATVAGAGDDDDPDDGSGGAAYERGRGRESESSLDVRGRAVAAKAVVVVALSECPSSLPVGSNTCELPEFRDGAHRRMPATVSSRNACAFAEVCVGGDDSGGRALFRRLMRRLPAAAAAVVAALDAGEPPSAGGTYCLRFPSIIDQCVCVRAAPPFFQSPARCLYGALFVRRESAASPAVSCSFFFAFSFLRLCSQFSCDAVLALCKWVWGGWMRRMGVEGAREGYGTVRRV